MKTKLTATTILSLIAYTVAIGPYPTDTSHSYDHKKDLEKLKHPNQDIHVLDIEEVRGKSATNIGVEEGNNAKVLLTALKKGYVVKKYAVDNIVTNILEASAAVEREDMVSLKK
mmetsp:Transcript_10473/g.15859  ORF Transcript_10473/g.15859 Transcript_10473/m.15859 type:complete len:114 (-) Transcript_10473:130-471(-)